MIPTYWQAACPTSKFSYAAQTYVSPYFLTRS